MDTAQNAICHWLPFHCGNQSDGFQLSHSVYAVRSHLEQKKVTALKQVLLGFSKSSFSSCYSALVPRTALNSGEGIIAFYCSIDLAYITQCMNESQS